MEDLIKLVPMNMDPFCNSAPTPYYVQGDIFNDNPLACIRLLQVAGAWEVRVYGDIQHSGTEEFAVLRVEYERDDSIALLSAYNTFNSIHEVLSVTQLRNAGFVIQ